MIIYILLGVILKLKITLHSKMQCQISHKFVFIKINLKFDIF